MNPPNALSLNLSTSSLATTSLYHANFHRPAGIDKRQNGITTSGCSGSASADDLNPCETVCGTESRQCVNIGHCFRPQLGETCCEDGTSCPSRGYCAQRSGQVVCCPQGSTLDECSATMTVATLPGAGSRTTSVEKFVSTSSFTVNTSRLTTMTATSELPTISSPSPWSSSTSTFGVGSTLAPYTASGYHPYAPSGHITSTANGTNTTLYTPARQTTNSGRKVEVVWWKMAGFVPLILKFCT